MPVNWGKVVVSYRKLRYGTTDEDRIECIRNGHDWGRDHDKTTYHIPKGVGKEAHRELPAERTFRDDVVVAGDLSMEDTPLIKDRQWERESTGSMMGPVTSSPMATGSPIEVRTYTIPETHYYTCTRCGAAKTEVTP